MVTVHPGSRYIQPSPGFPLYPEGRQSKKP